MAGIAIVGVPHHTRNSTMNMQTTCTAHIDVDDIGHGHWCCYILHIQYKWTVTGVTSMLQQSSIHPSIRASRTDGAEDCSLMFCMSFVGMWIYRPSHRIVRSQQDEVFGPAFAGLSPRKWIKLLSTGWWHCSNKHVRHTQCTYCSTSRWHLMVDLDSYPKKDFCAAFTSGGKGFSAFYPFSCWSINFWSKIESAGRHLPSLDGVVHVYRTTGHLINTFVLTINERCIAQLSACIDWALCNAMSACRAVLTCASNHRSRPHSLSTAGDVIYLFRIGRCINSLARRRKKKLKSRRHFVRRRPLQSTNPSSHVHRTPLCRVVVENRSQSNGVFIPLAYFTLFRLLLLFHLEWDFRCGHGNQQRAGAVCRP